MFLSSGAAGILLLTLIGVGSYYYVNKSSASTSTPTTNNGGSSSKPPTAAVGSGSVAAETVAPLPATTSTTAPTAVTPLAPVSTPLTTQQKLVYSFIPAPNIDNSGNDIRCVMGSSDASAAREACASQDGCVGYNVIAPHGNDVWRNGGYCLKKTLDNIVAGAPCTLYAAPGALPNPDIFSWSALPGKDYPGSDIRCWKNGEPLTVAQAACSRDVNCNAVVQVAGPAGYLGCCSKTGVDASKATNNSAVTLYVKPKVTVN